MLLDDKKYLLPTKKILNSLIYLANDCDDGGVCFVHYSGHSGSIKEIDNDEIDDSRDETLMPVDF